MRPLNVLDWEYFHNSVRDWLIALGILVGVAVFLVVVRQVIGRRLGAATATPRHGPGRVDALIADLVQRTRFFFVLALALMAASLELTLPPSWDRGTRGISILALVLQVAIWGNGLIAFALHTYVARRSTPSGGDGDGGIVASRTTVAALGVVARVVLWLLLLLVALDTLGVHVTTLIAGLGVTGIALALAVQNILGDLFAALSIVMDKPFVVGDAITVDTLSGTVEHIGLKTTRLRAHTGEQIVFSNADLLKSRVRNFRRLRERTVTLSVVLDQATAPEAAARVPGLLRDIVTAQPGVRFARSHVTVPNERGIPVETVYVVASADYGRYMDAQQAITLELLRRLRQAGIGLAAPGGVTIVREQATSSYRVRSESSPVGEPVP
jgi:small-conductance mechanosensitive channel